MKVFKLAEIADGRIALDGSTYSVVEGKHSIWIPDLEIKLIRSFNGKIEALDWEKGRNALLIENGTFNDACKGFDGASIDSIANEYTIFAELAKHRMAPQMVESVYVEMVVSDFPYHAAHCDTKGWYGYVTRDARKLEPGEFTIDNFYNRFIKTGLIRASDGAIGDLQKTGNVVNGYLVDVRRTLWDMLRWRGDYSFLKPAADLLCNAGLRDDIKRLGQFPYGERQKNYQSYFLDGEYVDGSRDTLYRFGAMGIPDDLSGQTMLDLGCCIGAMSIEAWRRGARRITGIDNEADYISCARSLAKANGFNVNFLRMSLRDVNQVLSWFRRYYDSPVDVVLALALYKHIGAYLWDLLKRLEWRNCYVESHNAPEGLETGHAREMHEAIKSCGWGWEYLGQSTDRYSRCLWRLSRE